MLSPLPEIRDGGKGLLFATSSSSSLAQQQVIYSACPACVSAVPQLLGWRWVHGKGSDTCALSQEDEQHAHNLSELFGGASQRQTSQRQSDLSWSQLK